MLSIFHRASLVSLFAATLLLPGCGGAKSNVSTFPMGQRVNVGRLIYNVLDAEWRTDIPGTRNQPKNRYLQLTVAITNSGGQLATVPLLRLIDANGNEIVEFAEIENNPKWLGTIRRLEPALTEQGVIYFDVPVGAYKLEVIDNSNPEDEKLARVEIPATLAPPPDLPSKGGPGGV